MRGLAAGGTTVVFATHHLDEADAVADRVVVVAGGRVVADGSAAQVKAGITGSTITFTAEPGTCFDGLPGVTALVRRGTTVELATAEPEERSEPCSPRAAGCPACRSAAPASRRPS